MEEIKSDQKLKSESATRSFTATSNRKRAQFRYAAKIDHIAFAPYGDYWRMLPKLCVLELLSAKRVRSFRSIREEEVWRVVRSISSSAWSPVNFRRMISSLTYCITSRAAFGKIWKGEDVFIPAVKEVNKAAGGYSLADVYPSIKLLSVISGMKLTLEKIHALLDKIVQDIINEHRSKKEIAAKTGADEEEHDLVVPTICLGQPHAEYQK